MSGRVPGALVRLVGLVGVVLILGLAQAAAVGVDAPLPDPRQEARARALAAELRCLVCQNQSIEESDAPLAADLRRLVRERIAAGADDTAVRAFVVERYGDWVLLDPPLRPWTWALWGGPAAIALLAAGSAALWLRRRRTLDEPAPLSAAEAEAVARLLADDPGAAPDGRGKGAGP